MTYENLAKTFDILSSHGAGSVVMDWAEHDEWASNYQVSTSHQEKLECSQRWAGVSAATMNMTKMECRLGFIPKATLTKKSLRCSIYIKQFINTHKNNYYLGYDT